MLSFATELELPLPIFSSTKIVSLNGCFLEKYCNNVLNISEQFEECIVIREKNYTPCSTDVKCFNDQNVLWNLPTPLIVLVKTNYPNLCDCVTALGCFLLFNI